MEIWKDIPGWEGLYQVSMCGKVKSLDRIVYNKGSGNTYQIKGKILKLGNSGIGYKQVILCKKGILKAIRVHKIVMLTFIGERPIEDNGNKYDINHINGIKHDNRIENLEYCTKSENQKHRFDVLGHRTWNTNKPI